MENDSIDSITKEVLKLDRRVLLVGLLIILAGCVPYGKPIATIGPEEIDRPGVAALTVTQFELQTNNLELDRIVDDLQPVPGVATYLPNVYAPSTLNTQSQQILGKFNEEVCNKYPGITTPGGQPLCGSTNTPSTIASTTDATSNLNVPSLTGNAMAGITGRQIMTYQIDIEGSIMSVSPTTVAPGENVTITLQAKNVGTLASTAVKGRIYLDGTLMPVGYTAWTPVIGSTPITTFPISSSLGPGGVAQVTHDITIPTTATPGPHEIMIHTYFTPYMGSLPDPNPYNNNDTTTITVTAPPAGPDLMLDQGSFQGMPPQPTAGTYMDILIDMENIGAGDVTGGEFRVYWDTKTTPVFTENLDTFVTMPYSSTAPAITIGGLIPVPATGGTHDLIMEVVPTPTDSDLGNNEVSIPITVVGGTTPPPTGQADLIIENMTYSPTGATSGMVVVTANIKNIGSITSSGAVLEYTVYGTTNTQVVTPLNPGQSVPSTFQFDLVALPATVFAKVDTTNLVTESNELNNENQITIGPAPVSAFVDLVAKKIIPDKTTYSANEPIDLRLAVQNIGSGDALGNNLVHLYVDNVLVHTYTTPLAAGTSHYEMYTLPNGLTAGTHTLKLEIDPNNDIPELQETNNVRTLTLNVAGVPGSLIVVPGSVLPPTTVLNPGFIVGSCQDPTDLSYNPMVRQRLGATYCDQMQMGDAIITSYIGTGPWNIIIAGATHGDVLNAIDMFLGLGVLGPAEIYEVFEYRKPRRPTLGLFAKYKNANLEERYMLDYTLASSPGATSVAFPIGLADNDMDDVFASIVGDIESVYRWDDATQKWNIWHPGPEPGDMDKVYPYDTYFIQFMDGNWHKLQLIDQIEQSRPRTFSTGRALFSPPRKAPITTWSHIVDVSQPIYCQQMAAAPKGWFFQTTGTTIGGTTGVPDIEIGQSCWITSKGGTLQ